MRENGFENLSWETGSISEVLRRMPPREMLTACGSESVRDAVSRMKTAGVSQMPVIEDGRVAALSPNPTYSVACSTVPRAWRTL